MWDPTPPVMYYTPPSIKTWIFGTFSWVGGGELGSYGATPPSVDLDKEEGHEGHEGLAEAVVSQGEKLDCSLLLYGLN